MMQPKMSSAWRHGPHCAPGCSLARIPRDLFSRHAAAGALGRTFSYTAQSDRGKTTDLNLLFLVNEHEWHKTFLYYYYYYCLFCNCKLLYFQPVNIREFKRIITSMTYYEINVSKHPETARTTWEKSKQKNVRYGAAEFVKNVIINSKKTFVMMFNGMTSVLL
jgi:hypothetical protein